MLREEPQSWVPAISGTPIDSKVPIETYGDLEGMVGPPRCAQAASGADADRVEEPIGPGALGEVQEAVDELLLRLREQEPGFLEDLARRPRIELIQELGEAREDRRFLVGGRLDRLRFGDGLRGRDLGDQHGVRGRQGAPRLGHEVGVIVAAGVADLADRADDRPGILLHRVVHREVAP